MALIGIAACRKLEDYKQAVLHVGGEVRLLDSSMQAVSALEGVDGLLLTGGDDVLPARYGEAPHAATVGAEEGRDDFEIALVKEARARALPRHPGAECRLRRHARAGHSVAGPRCAQSQPRHPAAPVVRPGARSVARERVAAVAA